MESQSRCSYYRIFIIVCYIKFDMSDYVAIWPFLKPPYFITGELKNHESLTSRALTIFRQSVMNILKMLI